MLTLFVFTMFLDSSFAAEKPPVVLGQGEQRIIKLSQVAKYSLGSDIARAKFIAASKTTESESLLVKGIKPGQTDLWVWKEDGSSEHRSLVIEKVSSNELPVSLMKALSRLEECEILYSGNGVTLRGEIVSSAEAARVSALLRSHPKEISDQTGLSATLLESAKIELSTRLDQAGFGKNLFVETAGSEIWIRGSTPSVSEQLAAQRIVDTVFPRARTEILALPDNAPTVHFKVFLLELKKNRFGNFGLEWPAVQEGAFQVSPIGIANKLQLDVALQTLEGNGSVRILSKPELVVRAPGEAELFAGGEIPLTSRNRFGSNVSWKNYGLTLKLNVTHSTRDRVRVDIFTEVSHLDTTTASNDIPGIQANRMKTQVDARYGTPLLLSGLLQQGSREAARGLPLLRRIPILGSLFGSEDYLNERSELVAILLPNLTPPPAPMARFETAGLPKGPVPLARNWISPSEIRVLKESPEYPWNAFQ